MGPIESYKQLRPTLEEFARRLQDLLADIAHSKNIEVHAIEARAKTLESFREKLARPGKSYDNPLKDITDLCGLRVILYYQEDVEKFCDELRLQLSVDEEKSVDKRKELGANQFGYISVHLISKITSARSQLIEWKRFDGLIVEVQVRTVLQHAWASISHALQYKREAEIPSQVVRKLSRVAGLLELADEQFSDLRSAREDVQRGAKTSLIRQDLAIEANKETLSKYLESSKVVDGVEKAARQAKLDVSERDQADQLVFICNALGIKDLSEVDSRLQLFLERGNKFFKKLSGWKAKSGTRRMNISGGVDHWCAVALAALASRDKRTTLISEHEIWSKTYLEQVRMAAGNTWPKE